MNDWEIIMGVAVFFVVVSVLTKAILSWQDERRARLGREDGEMS